LALVNFAAGAALVARLSLFPKLGIVGPCFAVGDFGQDSGGSCFAGAAGAVKEISVADFVGFGGVF
jgi:hypothetical protein